LIYVVSNELILEIGMSGYKFVDANIDCEIDGDRIFIEADPDRCIWAEIHEKDIEEMARIKGMKVIPKDKKPHKKLEQFRDY
jgi:hypothetical protein